MVLYWVLMFTPIGMFVLAFSPAAQGKGVPWMFGASLDHLLPIVELNKEFGDFFNDPLKGDPPKRERLHGWQVAYFAAHALVGFLLGTFVLAGLTGLTQAR